MTRKYYKQGLSVYASKIIVDYTCPNTKEEVSIELEEWKLRGYEDRLGTIVSAWIDCESCKKKHDLYLVNN